MVILFAILKIYCARAEDASAVVGVQVGFVSEIHQQQKRTCEHFLILVLPMGIFYLLPSSYKIFKLFFSNDSIIEYVEISYKSIR